MLHSETKRKIDNARDILVGKIPVPMSQIEQITLAMTYKFMSDIDEDNKLLGGKTFFEGDFEKYTWKNLMDKRLGAQERMNQYSEGLESMSKNRFVPELFRDIFRNAYLPFKDPQTLDRFLKQINEFSYDHSEELGNAFEYLLSTAGSQGDAGQFRTPRHIIDFLVSIVDPTKDDTILDPACGTAGFLISAYKHILAQNTIKNPGDKLSREEKDKLSKNIAGYDISHDMVRLSLVNLYLHGFADPKISEYDTLSSDDKWNEDFNCILANPPFMTPKGGIEPHSRFSIKASKSEVLFVDYIMEHLTLNGKAGIIVPEGIIFQSANAYKELRKNMIENNFLWGVVSLPSGIFQPYSGVKTSILLFDKQIAKKTDKIIFVKVEQDGYDLGAQRREINKNDLPNALELLLNYKKSILSETEFENTSKNVLIIENSKIKESGDYNLRGERYRENISLQNSDFEMVELSKLVEIKTGKKNVNSGNESGKYPFFTCAKEHTFSNEYSFDTEALLIAGNGDVGSVKYFKGKFEAYQRTYVLSDFKNVLPKYLYVCLDIKLKETVSKLKLGNTMPYIKLGMLQDFKIPLPSLEIQEQITEELDNYQKIIDGAKQIVENYKTKIDKKTKPISIKEKIINALKKLLKNDLYLLKNDVNERSISAKLMKYLEEEFLIWDVDHEYNRQNDTDTKKIDNTIILPDIIIHKRGTDNNYIVLELKKNEDSKADREKLENLVKLKKYKYAFQINIQNNKQLEDWIIWQYPNFIFEDKQEWEFVELGEVCEIGSGGTPSKSNELYWNSNDIPWLRSEVCKDKYVYEANDFISNDGFKNSSAKLFKPETTLIALVGATIGKTAFLTFESTTNQNIAGLYPKDINKLSTKFLFFISQNLYDKFINLGNGDFKMASLGFIKTLKIPLPPLEIQEQIVAKIEKEQKIVEGVKGLIEIFENKIKERIGEVWGEK